MKMHLSKVIVLILTLTISSVLAGPKPITTFEVDFDFHIGNTKYSKGKYKLSKGSQSRMLILENLTHKDETRVLLAMPPSNSLSANVKNTLRFNRYGDTYFLREVLSPSISARVLMSRDEKKVRKNAHQKRANVNIKSKN